MIASGTQRAPQLAFPPFIDEIPLRFPCAPCDHHKLWVRRTILVTHSLKKLIPRSL